MSTDSTYALMPIHGTARCPHCDASGVEFLLTKRGAVTQYTHRCPHFERLECPEQNGLVYARFSKPESGGEHDGSSAIP